MVSSVLIVCTPSVVFEAALVCSTADRAKVLLIAVQELHVWPIQIYAARTIRRTYGLQEIDKRNFV